MMRPMGDQTRKVNDPQSLDYCFGSMAVFRAKRAPVAAISRLPEAQTRIFYLQN